jgi:hypothetical protein
MKYFQLRDDVHIPSRWHLGEVRLADGAAVNLRKAQPLALSGPVSIDVGVPGRSLEFSLTSFAGPIATARLAQVIGELAEQDVEVIPARVGGRDGYAALNATRQVQCLDETRSTFTKWTMEDHRADLAGQYRMVVKLRVDPTSVPQDAHLFRVEGWRVALIVSQAVKDAMEASGCFGATFEEVS